MTPNSTVLRGVVHGKNIELEEDAGFPEGQQVCVVVQVLPESELHLPPGEGLRRSFGGWAEDTEELDDYLEWNRQQRKISRPPIKP